MDKGVTTPLFGNYRAKVVENIDTEQFGRVLVWIPDLMPDIPDSQGVWARPANNPIGGRNIEEVGDQHYMGTSYIPRKGSWTWVFFESGNINRPYYFGALDLQNTKVLPENQLGKNFQDKWTIFKSHDGRVIVVSDDPDDARTEITGKKRLIKDPPSGDTDSVYTIDKNQTTILFDERATKEKILIRTHKGDFFHIDIDEQNLQAYFKNDMKLQCDGDFFLTVNGDINIKCKAGDGAVEFAAGKLDIKTSGDYKETVGASKHQKVQNDSITSAGQNIDHKAGKDINDDAGGNVNEQGGGAKPAQAASGATDANPKGERDT